MIRTLLVGFAMIFYTAAYPQDNNITSIGHLPYPTHLLNCVWGYNDSNGNEYALVGTYDGISIVDISSPSSPCEVHFIPTVNSVWKDIQTYSHYAYIVHGIYNGTQEETDGLLIIDLRGIGSDDLSPYIHRYKTPEYQTAHNIFIDDKTGYAYLFGVQERGGALILNLKENPISPTILGSYDRTYLHDGYVRDGILYGCADKDGRFIIIDVSDPSSPREINSAQTPNRTTHNAWLSDDGHTLFTTDEKMSAYISSYDVSNHRNIRSLGKVRAADYSQAIPHNATVVGDFIFTSYYNQGVKIFDATQTDNMIEVASYQTCTGGSRGQFDGAWGIYPYMDSGLILVSDMNTGLHILRPTLTRAAYLRGNITDEEGRAIFNASLRFTDDKSCTYSDIDGTYRTGSTREGLREIEINADGYHSVKMDVDMRSGITTSRDIILKKIEGDSSSQIMETYVRAYPNPFYADRLLNVEYSFDGGIDDRAYLEIMDMAGRTLYHQELYNNQGIVIVGKELSRGTYLLRVVNGTRYSRVIKIVKA